MKLIFYLNINWKRKYVNLGSVCLFSFFVPFSLFFFFFKLNLHFRINCDESSIRINSTCVMNLKRWGRQQLLESTLSKWWMRPRKQMDGLSNTQTDSTTGNWWQLFQPQPRPTTLPWSIINFSIKAMCYRDFIRHNHRCLRTWWSIFSTQVFLLHTQVPHVYTRVTRCVWHAASTWGTLVNGLPSQK